jgi:hypothetical protein
MIFVDIINTSLIPASKLFYFQSTAVCSSELLLLGDPGLWVIHQLGPQL